MDAFALGHFAIVVTLGKGLRVPHGFFRLKFCIADLNCPTLTELSGHECSSPPAAITTRTPRMTAATNKQSLIVIHHRQLLFTATYT
ncbi:hypothetical protein OUZ56_028324 [Daphnia magna]|uniref:Secreted protein n=1 Tax=Daphnia magna TaxID=35525 RepID=A0ABR0B3I2_9CRUS|nr:hypothetical protein OUZ56_028324 [Daphnia magna]